MVLCSKGGPKGRQKSTSQARPQEKPREARSKNKKMQIKTFVLPVLSSECSEEELNRFLRGHRVLQVERHFCPDSGGYWAILVEYVDSAPV